MSNERSYAGSCFCGTVQFIVTGDPGGMGYCHCESCRSWSGSPVNAFTLWPVTALRVTRGQDNIGSYAKTPNSQRKWCKNCGGHIYTEHPEWGLVDVYAASIPDLEFAPGVHVNYEDTVLPITDDLPKLKDFPEELGGSGQQVTDPNPA